ncbi:tRNA (adenosine(37)-N6)-threonylcarbamoyltransferase complex ATPase subunit type 1 TsaE [Pelagibacterales bacterium]|nr:tRNA (adenosine(37)-N6)-threonylcarbamoyltransferase complex ATPase subunit type 1 TsaE [Pelagibacterales bacterium]
MIVLKEEDTRKIANKFAKSIPKDCVICLNGDLGAGKTTFSRYLIQTIIKDRKISGEIPSPTFSLLQTYKDKNFTINHYDFYRLENSDDLIELDYDNSISKGICIIEWASKFPEALPANRIEINIDLVSKSTRSLNFIFIGNINKKDLKWCLE